MLEIMAPLLQNAKSMLLQPVMQDLIRQSAMTLVCSQQQRNFPADLFKVRMYALKPR